VNLKSGEVNEIFPHSEVNSGTYKLVDGSSFIIKVLVFGIISLQAIGLSTGQEADFFVGINANRFYDFQKNEGHFKSSYSPGIGYQAGLTIS
jgi:hypothetical protein